MRCAVWLGLLLCTLPARVSARADIVGIVSGSGFTDSTAVQPVGGNPGTTLGEQRRLALIQAFELWGERLESRVPIEVAFEFEALGCANGTTILGGAAPANAYSELPGTSSKLFYVSALANSLAGRDLDPAEPDIIAQFNSSVDKECMSGTGGFYYGFDGKSPGAVDFVQVVLHELGHGLGLTSLVDIETGALIAGAADSYTANVRDLDLDQAWPALSDAQRKLSAGNVRRVAWDGAHAGKLVPQLFAAGEPALLVEPKVAEFTGAVADVAFAENPALGPVSGQLHAAGSCNPRNVPAGAIVLFPAECEAERAVQAAAQTGAAGALVVSTWPFTTPAMPLDKPNGEPDSDPVVKLPVLSLATGDAASLQRALGQGPLRATLGGDATRRMGADAKQRPLLFASRPASQGSTISHVEQLVRPNQLMEPYATRETANALGFTLALLSDIGWPISCGNGQTDAGEECDDGERNSDVAPDACRTDCRRPRCGDGVQDRGEGCDSATGNDDTQANGCRTSCQPASCGDGVVDRAEQCDRGSENSDTSPNACRKGCQLPQCGDAVVDSLEQCDDGKHNDDERPNACRMSCRTARCGDGVVDDAEGCDEGRANSASRANACRPSCAKPGCGDGVIDDGEACDGTPDCSAACKLPEMMTPARDRGSQAAPMRGDEPAPAEEEDVDAGSGEEPAEHPAADSGGCSCRVPAGRSSGSRGSAWFAALWLLYVVRRWRNG